MADVPAKRTTPVSTSVTNANVATGEPIGRVNVYETDAAQTAPTPSLDGQKSYANEPAPVTSNGPGMMTWLLILVVVILALYFVVQFLT